MPTPRPAPAVGARPATPRGKAQRPECSQAASAWNLARRGKPAPMAPEQVFSILAKCRAMKKLGGRAAMARAAGQEAKAQHLEHVARSGQPLTAQARTQRAVELARLRRTKAARRERPPVPINREALQISCKGCNASRPRRFAEDPARRKWYAIHRNTRFVARLTGGK